MPLEQHAIAPAFLALAMPPDSEKPRQKISLKASIAEFLLVNKLRARNLLHRLPKTRADEDHTHTADRTEREAETALVIARYNKILAVTCKDWFGSGAPDQHHQRRL